MKEYHLEWYETGTMANSSSSNTGAAETRAPSPDLLVSQEQVSVILGEEAKEFKVHKAFLCHYSGYFRKALDGNFLEATTNRVELKHTRPEVFAHLVHWLYTRKIKETHCIGLTLPREERMQLDTPDYDVFIKLWVLADYLDMPVLQNYIIGRLAAKMSRINTVPTIILKLLYEATVPSSPLRKFLVDKLVWTTHPSDWYRASERYNQEIMTDIACALHERFVEPKIPVDPLNDLRNYYVEKVHNPKE